eukprot:FN604484.1.p1 GENE.FN604484.1~~FN604484.1.p1  ORF type:complete len:54 (+),score=3.92 FN604484.1:82-243(+)
MATVVCCGRCCVCRVGFWLYLLLFGPWLWLVYFFYLLNCLCVGVLSCRFVNPY